MVRILLVDDHQIVRDGIKNLLEANPEMNVIGEATNAQDALDIMGKLTPDLLITDITLINSSGIDLSGKVRQKYPNVKILMLSMHDSEDYINQSLKNGANGYLMKDCTKHELMLAVTNILAGELYISKSASQVLMNNMFNKTVKFPESAELKQEINLTKRESEILQLISEGLSNKEIADKIFLSTRTVDTHRYNILQKFKAKNTAEMLNKALKLKLIQT
jgi:DNA-binding NarL/FixJ family response regulator